MKNKQTLYAASRLKSLRAHKCAVECMRLRGEDEAASRLERTVEAEELALRSMHPDDRELLTALFVERGEGALERLCLELDCTASTVYRRRRRALAEYALRLYGITDAAALDAGADKLREDSFGGDCFDEKHSGEINFACVGAAVHGGDVG